MKLENFIKNFAEQLGICNAEELNGDTDFRQLDEWSSLTVVQLISFVMEIYDVELTVDDIRKVHTMQELFNLINR